ncbi:predicted protein [Nematostella vectensis]|uniref:YqaJ viral recombinase domain-containing protein n=1 Tax=Nematostella vectensis TaxID=45351 RepID=A7T1Z6_NEMVE|nr:predicted protein [Nematostella vectensis]|eukprot:XP_001622118.1 predicted protein [Nematostella vectensis]
MTAAKLQQSETMVAKLPSDRVLSLPKYRELLDPEVRKNYNEKLKSIANIDPYNVSRNFFTDSWDLWPEIQFPDIVNYLLFSTSNNTKEELKAYKSLDAYQYFVAGWVNHSQRMNKTPLKAWIAANRDGSILTAHCNCMAGTAYCPKTVQLNLPKPLSDLYDITNTKLYFDDLLKKSKETFHAMKITPQQARDIEEATRDQSKSSLCFGLRAGRITSRKFHQACHTNPLSPSVSLIKDVCYGSKFLTAEVRWGRTHEKDALDKYKQSCNTAALYYQQNTTALRTTQVKRYLSHFCRVQCVQAMKDKHQDFHINESGLFINPDHPHLGVSPDAISSCKCHGAGCVEVKCPYSARVGPITADTIDCLVLTPDGRLQLDRKHAYYSQLQLQMASTTYHFVDFVVWTPSDLFIERVYPDNALSALTWP